MLLTSRHDLIFVTATVTYRQTQIEIPDVLLDTGAASSIIDADLAGELGIFARHGDEVRTLRGVGGKEHVFMRHVDRFAIGPHGIDNFHLEFGDVDYGFHISGIVGMDFLVPARSVIDLGKLEITFGDAA